MTESTDFDAPTKPAWIGAMVPVVLVLAAAGLFWWISAKKETEGNGKQPFSPALASSGKLVNGQTYYLFASEIELYPTRPDNDGWDGGESGPDIRYRVLWKNNEVFDSDVVDDSLIGHWSGLAVKLKWGDLLGKTFSPEKSIRAALVGAEKDGTVIIEVEDVDFADNDEAGSVTIALHDLLVGKKEFTFPKSSDNAVRRIVMRALPVNSSASDLVKLMN